VGRFYDLPSQKLLLNHNNPSVRIFWLIDFNTLSLKAAFSMDIPGLKPNCSGSSILV
jgi:hypothetical protein